MTSTDLEATPLTTRAGLFAAPGVGAAIHGWVPEAFFVDVAGPENPLAGIGS